MLFSIILFTATTLKAQQSCPVTGSMESIKMNILYIGAENVIDYAVNNTDPKSIKFTCEGCDSIIKQPYPYSVSVWVSKVGVVNLKMKNEEMEMTKSFRVKYCPNPNIFLFNGQDFDKRQKSGIIKADMVKQLQSIIPVLENFDFDLKCTIVSFQLTRTRNDKAETFLNELNAFNENNINLLKSAQKGDLFTITDIKGSCTGDKIERNWDNIVFYVE